MQTHTTIPHTVAVPKYSFNKTDTAKLPKRLAKLDLFTIICVPDTTRSVHEIESNLWKLTQGRNTALRSCKSVFTSGQISSIEICRIMNLQKASHNMVGVNSWEKLLTDDPIPLLEKYQDPLFCVPLSHFDTLVETLFPLPRPFNFFKREYCAYRIQHGLTKPIFMSFTPDV